MCIVTNPLPPSLSWVSRPGLVFMKSFLVLHSSDFRTCITKKKDKDKREDKGGLCCLREKCIQSLPRFRSRFRKIGLNSSCSSNQPGAIHPILQIVLVQNCWRSKELNTSCPPKSSDDFCLSLYLSFSLSVLFCQCWHSEATLFSSSERDLTGLNSIFQGLIHWKRHLCS